MAGPSAPAARAVLEKGLDVLLGDEQFRKSFHEHSLLDDFVQQMKQRGLKDSYDLLTDREKEIFQLLAEGKSNKEVAAMLNLSPYTVETHRTHIMQKLDLHSSVELVLYAVRKKIIS